MRLAFAFVASSALGLSSFAAGCSAKTTGQLVLVVQTDLSLPKDIDSIRIEVFDEGVPKFRDDFSRLGTTDGQIHLPGTLGLIASDNPEDTIQIIVSARTGGIEGEIRIVREVVTTIPPDRAATLELPLQFLCDGSGKTVGGEDTSNCQDQHQTCLAGTCASNTVDSSKLPTFDANKVYGSGSCLDVYTCFDHAAVADVDMKGCTIDDPSDVNVALETEGDGICGDVGCFVALDANDPLGWTRTTDGLIQLPVAVCEKLATGVVVHVVTTPPTTTCALKGQSLPTCGPWSITKKNAAPPNGPLVLAGGQAQPTSIGVVNQSVVWVDAGIASTDGAVKSVVPTGGTPDVLRDKTPARDVAATDAFVVWTSSVPGKKASGAISRFQDGNVTELVGGLDSPEGLTTGGGLLFWTDFDDGQIYEAGIDGSSPRPIAKADYPYRIVADDKYVYWTNEGTAAAMTADGSVARFDYVTGGDGTPTILASAQRIPRAIAMDLDASGRAKAIFFASFQASGEIVKVDVSGAAPSEPTVLVSGLSYPNGITLDAKNIYWSNRGSGTIQSIPIDAAAGDAVTTLADDQRLPGPMAVDDSAIYWVNAGPSDVSQGSVVKLAKAQ